MIAHIFHLDFIVLMGESGPRLMATTTNAFKVQPSTRKVQPSTRLLRQARCRRRLTSSPRRFRNTSSSSPCSCHDFMAKRYSCGVEIALSGGSISLGVDEVEVAALTEPWLRFPVVCPACRREELTALPIAGVAAALLNGSAIPLHVSCHDFYWHASLIEIEQLREYLIVAGIGIDRIKREGIAKEKTARRRPIR